MAIACQKPALNRVTEENYEGASVRFLSTDKHGAVMIRSDGRRMVVETYRTGECWVLRSGKL